MKLLTLTMSNMLHKVVVHLVRLETSEEPIPSMAFRGPSPERREEVRTQLGGATWLAAHYWLRELLAAEIGCPPAKVPIVMSQGRKPCLAGHKIEFSLSHSEDWCAVAISPDCPVGVDVEAIHPVKDIPELASNFFSPGARAFINSAPPSIRHTEFLRSWTRVEAAVKACGRGLDDAPACLPQVVLQSCEDVPGVALSVAALCTGALEVDWRIPDPYPVLSECLVSSR